MQAFWEQKIMIRAVTKIASFDVIHQRFVGNVNSRLLYLFLFSCSLMMKFSKSFTFNVIFISFFFNSDKNSPCCQNCKFMAVGIKCRDAQYATCEQESRCTGQSSECPKSPPMQDGTGCLERGQCRGGKCVPYCETQNLQSCMCDTSTCFIKNFKY